MKRGIGPDERSMGGRKQIIQNLYSHHSKLMNIKSTMTFEKPHEHVDSYKFDLNGRRIKKSKKKKSFNKQNEETYETFKRAYKAKADIKITKPVPHVNKYTFDRNGKRI